MKIIAVTKLYYPLTENFIAKSSAVIDADTVKKELNGFINANNQILNVYIATKNKNMYIYPETELPMRLL